MELIGTLTVTMTVTRVYPRDVDSVITLLKVRNCTRQDAREIGRRFVGANGHINARALLANWTPDSEYIELG